jgi:hypothetical protein
MRKLKYVKLFEYFEQPSDDEMMEFQEMNKLKPIADKAIKGQYGMETDTTKKGIVIKKSYGSKTIVLNKAGDTYTIECLGEKKTAENENDAVEAIKSFFNKL